MKDNSRLPIGHRQCRGICNIYCIYIYVCIYTHTHFTLDVYDWPDRWHDTISWSLGTEVRMERWQAEEHVQHITPALHLPRFSWNFLHSHHHPYYKFNNFQYKWVNGWLDKLVELPRNTWELLNRGHPYTDCFPCLKWMHSSCSSFNSPFLIILCTLIYMLSLVVRLWSGPIWTKAIRETLHLIEKHFKC